MIHDKSTIHVVALVTEQHRATLDSTWTFHKDFRRNCTLKHKWNCGLGLCLQRKTHWVPARFIVTRCSVSSAFGLQWFVSVRTS